MENPLMPAPWRQTCDDRANAKDMRVEGNEYFHKGNTVQLLTGTNLWDEFLGGR
jgi:hypothetical protein